MTDATPPSTFNTYDAAQSGAQPASHPAATTDASATTAGSSTTNTTTADTSSNTHNNNTSTSTNPTTDNASSLTGMAATATSTAGSMAVSAASTAASAAAGVKDNVFSMFGGGPKKEVKSEKEGEAENDRSGSSKAKAAEAKEADKEKEEKDDEAVDVEAEPEHHFEPVVHLTEQVAVVTGEENHDVVHKVRAKMFKFDTATTEWKERGVGELKLLKSNDTGRTKLVMRRDKTWKVCATHYVTALAPLDANVGSDRSWVYTAYYDVSEGMDPTKGVTVAMRFANKDAALDFKTAYEKYGAENDALKGSTTDTPENSTSHGAETAGKEDQVQPGETHAADAADAAAV